jgi:hypothetical protein
MAAEFNKNGENHRTGTDAVTELNEAENAL